MKANTKFKQTEIGEIPENWEIVEYGDIAKLNKNTFSPSKDINEKYLGLEHLNQGGFSINSIGNSNNINSLKFKFETNDILFGKLRPYFKKIYKPNFSGVCSTDIWVIKSKNDSKIDQTFLYYLTASEDFVKKTIESSEGTRMPRASWNFISKQKFILPSIEDQKQIASILSSLDDKIELNQKAIKTLEEIGQTLFKRWFIDFEFPNEKGEPYKSSGGEMIDSELGEIPKGWVVGSIKDIATVKSGFAFKSEDFNNQGIFGVIKIKNINDGVVDTQNTDYISENSSQKASTFKLSSGDILIAMSGNTTGKTGIMPKSDLVFYLNQRVGKYFLKKDKEIYNGFINFQITKPDIKQNTIEKAYGSAQPNISPSILESCEIVLPSTNKFETILEFFNQIIFEISEKTYEISKLSNLRDSFLPKLLSGKIRV